MLESNFRLVFHSKSLPKKSIEGFLGPKNSSEGIFRNTRQNPHFSVEYKSEGFGDERCRKADIQSD